MSGDKLHAFDLELCRYVLDNVGAHLDQPDFAAFVEEQLPPPLVAYLKAREGDEEPPALLLNDAELEELTNIFGLGPVEFNKNWIVSESLHRRAINCVAEIRDALAPEYAREWARASAQFAAQLEGAHVWLDQGIEIVGEWVGEVRRLLRAMGATTLLPYPQGSFPTPTHPTPPTTAPAPPQAPTVQSGQLSDAALAGLAETQALQREIRDLLVSQRTVKELYSTSEVASILQRAEYTVREWCRQGRIRATKKPCGRGKGGEWLVSHEELTRLRNEGLLPPPRPT